MLQETANSLSLVVQEVTEHNMFLALAVDSVHETVQMTGCVTYAGLITAGNPAVFILRFCCV